mgnify:CR=1 FL=1
MSNEVPYPDLYDPNGKAPYEHWFRTLRNRQVRAIILQRIDRVRRGNLGDCKNLGGGIYELRLHIGPGYRVYFGLHGQMIVLLLCGGDKGTQDRDIEAARDYWREYNQR